MQTLIVRTTSMAPSGEAVGHFEEDGRDAVTRRAVLVRGGAPDEVVRVRLDASSRPARGEIVEVVEPSASRVAPPCKWIDACGGCDWMHLSRQAQRDAHVALAASIAKGAPVTFHEAPAALAYRTRARVHVRPARRGRRTAECLVGFFGARSHDVVVVDSCIVLDPRVEAARASASSFFRDARCDGEVSLALGRDALPVADAHFSGDLPAEMFARLDAEVAARRWAGFAITSAGAKRPAVIGDPTPWIDGADGAPLELASGGFSQANDEVNRALAARVAELAGREKKILELYAGAGNFTVLLARSGELRAVESSEPACEAARRNLAARGLSGKITCADASTFEIPSATPVVVLDPPRTGAREACERIAKARGVRRVVYVSCDRATLARDAAILAPTFAVRSIDVLEMFPSTSHAETVVLFERA
ncbi:MAG TPA: class I SAM-dependent RNA methyltransferase [Polyangiaceae bacterium]|jgi:23S rRNA (uracil1939-C5)-methyltransferase